MDRATPLVGGAQLIERGVRLSRSILWRLQRRFYEERGIEAWRQGTVPHYITSNPFIARSYADVIHGFLRDALANNPPAPESPLWIVELGAGSGRFSYHLLQNLDRVQALLPASAPRIRYLMTDVVERNLEAWRGHPQLAPFVSSGLLDFARFDVTSDSAPRLTNGSQVEPGAWPIVVIANYVFDSLPVDFFYLRDGRPFESLVTLAGDPSLSLDDPELLHRLGGSFHYAPAPPDYYHDPLCNRLPAGYAERPGPPFLSIPIAALSLCARLRKLSGDRLLLLVGDTGAVNEDVARHDRPSPISWHGSVSLAVNFHALADWVRASGGAALTAPHEAGSLTVAAFLFGPGLSETSDTRRAFAAIARFGPDDFFQLEEALIKRPDDLSLDAIMSLFRLSLGDPRVVASFLPTLSRRALAKDITEPDRRDLERLLCDTIANYFHLGEPDNFPFAVGVTLFDLERYRSALDCLELSLRLYGRNPNVLAKLAQCHELALAR